MRRLALIVSLALLTPDAQPRAEVGAVQIRMATLVPEGSLWDKGLRRMAAEWSRSTQGRVSITIFPGGAMGDESTIVRKMRFDNP